ncbi:glycosyltransferase family 2 protein [Swaminathania salitolerans]|uniref:Glycosyl transferase family 2 n=1 Tax=Swaminathania salitolerans TaxID=182838 RepID=A0A511BSK6_9PROT|nr:glycosyltransferase family 2 protein [Swaminathania salitolerans]GBQ13394.1 hypothetical protein AA21291_1494 [Swaminathania salitolerans LMG 21291]GEL03307.1 hypothetical protein SSA02_24700 [Swaminathania salitolerans]
MAKAAAILFVRNDADDIGWWLAYHIAIGFDRLIVHDDRSDDGTWECVQAAAHLFPIETHRVTSVKDSYAERRSDAFMESICACRSRFDWVICLESDEYVFPEEDAQIGPYLDRFPEADGIALNWSVYGANGHVARTLEAPLAAYTRRAPQDFPDHVLGKSFIRPECYRDHPVDGYAWSLDPGRYRASDGSDYIQGIRPSRPGARILHYVTRNMAHYTQRLSRLPKDLTPPDLWTYYNRNDEEDRAPLRFLEPTRRNAGLIRREGLDTLFWRIRQETRRSSHDFLAETVFTIRSPSQTRPQGHIPAHTLERATLADETGALLSFDERTGSLVFAAAGTGGVVPVWLILDSASPEEAPAPGMQRGILHLPDTAALLPDNPALASWLPVLIDAAPARPADERPEPHRHVHIRLAPEGAFLGRSPEGLPLLLATLPATLSLVSHPMDRATETAFRPYRTLRSFGDGLRDFCLGIDILQAPHADAISCAIAHLAPEARRMLALHFPGLVPLWLLLP